MSVPQFTITGEQAEALHDLLGENNDGAEVTFTKQGVGADMVVAFSLATFEVSAGGTVDEA